jgi:hypothetical protein
LSRSWWERTRHACLKAWQWEPLRRALVLYLAARAIFTLWAVLVLRLVPADTAPAPERPYFGITPLNQGLPGLLLGPWQRFDTLHYVALAMDGYQTSSSHTVFPPLYPLLIRIIGDLLGGQYLLAALLISNLCAIGYLALLFLLAEQEVGLAAARQAQVYALVYPWAFILLAGYSESLFLFLAGLAFWLALRGRGWAAGLCGALAALTRLQGGALALPLLLLAVQRRRFRLWPPRLDLAWPLLPVLASAGFLVGRAWAGIEPLAVTQATYWHQVSAAPWTGITVNLQSMLSGAAHPTDYLDFAAAWFAIVLTVIAWRRLRPAYALYMTVVLLFSISHLRTPHPMSSVGRYVMELFPGFFLLGRWGKRSTWLNRLIVYPSALLSLWLSGQFVLWGWVG